MSSISQPITSSAGAKANPYLNKGFLGVAIVLALSAAALNILVFNRDLHFKKLAVLPGRDLKEIAPSLGTWLQVSKDEPLDPNIQEVLGTDRYIYRDYLDVPSHDGQAALLLLANLDAEDAKQNPQQFATQVDKLRDEYLLADPQNRLKILNRELEKRDSNQRKNAIEGVQAHFADAVVNMGVTYYTGLVDTVAHIPDRCYIASGYEPTDAPVEPMWTLPTGRQLQVRFINFEDQNGKSTIPTQVAYFFHVDGEYKYNPLGVRFSLENLFVKYGYYAKVELQTLDKNVNESPQTMQSFLGGALPEIEKSWPDWNKLIQSSGK